MKLNLTTSITLIIKVIWCLAFTNLCYDLWNHSSVNPDHNIFWILPPSYIQLKMWSILFKANTAKASAPSSTQASAPPLPHDKPVQSNTSQEKGRKGLVQIDWSLSAEYEWYHNNDSLKHANQQHYLSFSLSRWHCFKLFTWAPPC